MKLYNVIVVWDVYATAESPDEARKAVMAFITHEVPAERLTPSESTALEAREERNIRQAWRDEKPLVGNDVSDVDFGKLKGKTTLDVFKMLYTKEAPAQTPKDAKAKASK